MIDEGQTARPTVLKADSRPAARDPRFVGDGRRLMIVVLVALAFVLVAGIVLAAVAIDRGIGSARREVARRDAAGQAAGRRAVAAAPRVPSDPASWITADDYPPDALRANDEGTVTITWVADPDGRIGDCKTLRSSGHASLDRAACAAILRRGRYAAVPAASEPRVFTRRVVWRIPD
ncbi:energy transducer TonB [Sphingomonas sp. A2-49]|uniref:energy transducer TonB n=1 Tax=Sphingomonas sp. A2-49 TaxID=1391375 RepID=UPI0021D1CD6A|nr:energy transducer TonB [Sphingomonas sp. A2-49]MCU6452815.1 energy transducer TonB [Sphingomonas sp. A2-49]